jgi:hypothetical protein
MSLGNSGRSATHGTVRRLSPTSLVVAALVAKQEAVKVASGRASAAKHKARRAKLWSKVPASQLEPR